MPVYFGFLAGTLGLWGLGEYYVKWAYLRQTLPQVMRTARWVQLPFGIIFGLWLGVRWQLLPVALAVTTLTMLAYLAYYELIDRHPVAVASAFVSVWPVAASFSGLVLLHEHATWLQLAGAMTALGGMVLVGSGAGNFELRDLRDAIPWLLVIFVFWGVGIVALKLVLVASTGTAIFASGLSKWLTFSVYAAWVSRRASQTRSDGDGPDPRSIGAAFFLSVGDICYLLAVRSGPIVVVAPLSTVYPLVTALLARRFLGERLAARQYAGVGLAVGGTATAVLGTLV